MVSLLIIPDFKDENTRTRIVQPESAIIYQPILDAMMIVNRNWIHDQSRPNGNRNGRHIILPNDCRPAKGKRGKTWTQNC
jgi:hypothetical protein